MNPRPQRCERCALPTELRPHLESGIRGQGIGAREWGIQNSEFRMHTSNCLYYDYCFTQAKACGYLLTLSPLKQRHYTH